MRHEEDRIRESCGDRLHGGPHARHLPGKDEVFEGLEAIESILARLPEAGIDPLADLAVRLARVGAITGRLIAVTRV